MVSLALMAKKIFTKNCSRVHHFLPDFDAVQTLVNPPQVYGISHCCETELMFLQMKRKDLVVWIRFYRTITDLMRPNVYKNRRFLGFPVLVVFWLDLRKKLMYWLCILYLQSVFKIAG